MIIKRCSNHVFCLLFYISKVGEKDYEDDLSSALLTHYYISKRSRGLARFSVVNTNEQCKGTKYVRVLAWDCCLVFPLLPTNILWRSFDRQSQFHHILYIKRQMKFSPEILKKTGGCDESEFYSQEMSADVVRIFYQVLERTLIMSYQLQNLTISFLTSFSSVKAV